MPTSGTYDFSPSVDDLLTEAWERCQMSSTIITGDHARSARRSLQAMLIDWTNRGINLWQVERQYTFVSVGQQTVDNPTGTADVLEVILTAYGIDIQLTAISRDEWAVIPNKTLSGRPVQFWNERSIAEPVLHLWPVPDKAYTLAINRIRMPQDVSASSQQPDAPVLWSEALYAGLAARIAEKWAPALEDKLQAKAERAYAFASGENRERVPITILPVLW